MGLSRRKFTKEFKEEAVRRLELGASLAEVARACEVNPNVLHRWRRELQDYGVKAFAGNGQRRADESTGGRAGAKGGPAGAGDRFFAAMLAACRGAAEAASIDYPRLVYPYLEKEMSLATPIPLERLCRLALGQPGRILPLAACSAGGRRRTWICATRSSGSRWSFPVTAGRA